MTRRRLLLLLYPAWWRHRYGEEARTILDQTPPTLGGLLDLLRGAADAWLRQRLPQPGFARFGAEARHVVVLAQQEARALRHDYVGTEHVLLGLLAAREGIASRALAELGVSPERVRARLLQVLEHGIPSPPARCSRAPSGADPSSRAMRLTCRAKKGFELSCRAADRLGDPDVEADHLLLGLLDEGEGIGAMILSELVELETVREHLARLRGR